MFQEWGSVEGDGNADAIIRDRKEGRRDNAYNPIINFVLLAVVSAWFAVTGSHFALAIEIILGAWLVGSGIRNSIYPLHTFVMIAERRA